MNAPIVIIGIGELGSVFARGFLRCGHPVYPITRAMDIATTSLETPEPALVLITVPENELHPILQQIPITWRHNIGLLQNELLPRDWQRHPIEDPTITVVWFEKKKNLELTNVLYTPTFGPNAALISKALKIQGIPVHILANEETLLFELVRKTVYILTVNIAGLVNNCTVSELWQLHQPLAIEIAEEVIRIQEYLAGQQLSKEKLLAGMVEGIEDCPDRYCLGRTAMARLERSLRYANDANIETPKLQAIYNKTLQN